MILSDAVSACGTVINLQLPNCFPKYFMSVMLKTIVYTL